MEESKCKYEQLREEIIKLELQLCAQTRLLEELIAQTQKTSLSANFTVDAVNGLYAVLSREMES